MQSASAVVRLFYVTVFKFIGGKLYSILTRSVFQYYMFCVIYSNFNESQRDLKMMSFCTILKFCHLHQE